jgi:hypothetical protein
MAKLLTLFLGIVSAASLTARTFTSAEGGKTIEAELIDYNPTSGKVVIRNEGSHRNVTVDADAFSAKDQAYFKEFLKEAAKRKSLGITVEKKSEKLEKTQGALYIYDRRNESFAISVNNSGPIEIEDLTVKYDIYVSSYDKEGKRVTNVVSGTRPIKTIAPNYSEEFETEAVQVTMGCVTTSSCPKCKTQAASVKAERVIGIHARILDSDGGLLTEFYSAGAVKTAAAKRARES